MSSGCTIAAYWGLDSVRDIFQMNLHEVVPTFGQIAAKRATESYEGELNRCKRVIFRSELTRTVPTKEPFEHSIEDASFHSEKTDPPQGFESNADSNRKEQVGN